MNKTITAENAPAAVGPYCHAKLAGNTLYTSGQLGLIPATGELPQEVEAQAAQALDNLKAVLNAAGMDFGDVVKTPSTPNTSPARLRPAPASRWRPCPRAPCLKSRPWRSGKQKTPRRPGPFGVFLYGNQLF